jgi:S-adenosylmethionine synthetase
MNTDFVFTSESVTDGHPDKLCDRISDAIVDGFLERDPYARIVAECAAAKGVVFIAARFAAEASLDIPAVARHVIHEVGYDEGEFNARDCGVLTSLVELPTDSRVSQDEGEMDEEALERLTAQNQVTVFGFACDQTAALMPLPIWLAHGLAQRLAMVRSERLLPYLTPDATTQVGVEYRERQPQRIHSLTVVVSQQSAASPNTMTLRRDLTEHVILPVFAGESIHPDQRTRIFINPEGIKVGGGPAFHSGLTGRKTATDTYGGYARHSGSALSGKDPLRIDRVAAYAARYAAKNAVAAGLARICEVQLSYSIGLAGPVGLQVETFGTGTIADGEIAHRLMTAFDFRLGGIIRSFDLRHWPARRQGGFYQHLAAYGQVGRLDLTLPWEGTELAPALR